MAKYFITVSVNYFSYRIHENKHILMIFSIIQNIYLGNNEIINTAIKTKFKKKFLIINQHDI